MRANGELGPEVHTDPGTLRARAQHWKLAGTILAVIGAVASALAWVISPVDKKADLAIQAAKDASAAASAGARSLAQHVEIHRAHDEKDDEERLQVREDLLDLKAGLHVGPRKKLHTKVAGDGDP